MFCGNCGANNPEGSSVCGSCGAALTPETPAADSKLPEGNKKIVGLAIVIGGAILVLALVIWLITALFGGGAKGVAVDYIKAGLKPNGGKTLVNLMPKAYVEEMLDLGEYDNKSELIKDVNDALEDAYDSRVDNYGKYKVKVEVRKVKDWKNDEIKDYNERMDDNKIDLEIKDGADVELKVTIDGKDDKESYKPTVSVIKVGGKWYLDPMGADIDY